MDDCSVGYSPKLTGQELQEMRALEQAGIAEGLHYKIDPDVDSGILCRRDGKLEGFMTVDCFNGAEVEAAAIAGSAADWDAMMTVLLATARERQAQKLLLIADPGDVLVTGKLVAMGLALAFTEYRMLLDAALFQPVLPGDISLRQATEADRAAIMELDAEAFGSPGQLLPRDLQNSHMILHGGQTIGKLRVDKADGGKTCGVYGVVVAAQHRGRGFGKQALSLLLSELLRQGAGDIYLEVDSENLAAFHLYKQLGFLVASEFRYYPCEL